MEVHLQVRPLGRTPRSALTKTGMGGTPVPPNQLTPGGRPAAGPAGKPPKKEDPYMPKAASSKKPISIRYTCAPNGDQVGLSHYLMADGKKAK